MLTKEAATVLPGRVFEIPASPLPWLAPGCILLGMAMQLGALVLRARGKNWSLLQCLACALGALAVMAGAALDRDVAVAVGEGLAIVGIWLAWRGT